MFTEGSKWRRWDLHTLTPQTTLNDQFDSWKEFLLAIEKQNLVRVLGITDYCSISNYSRLKRHREEDGRIPEIDLLIPNIKFRLTPPNDHAKSVNIHLLISADDPNHESEFLNALGRLSWPYDGNNYSCIPERFIALGRSFSRRNLDDRTALCKGITQFKIDFSKFREWYNNESWLKANSLMTVCLERYIVAQGKTQRDAVRNFGKMLALEMKRGVRKGHQVDPLTGIPPAPTKYWDLFTTSTQPCRYRIPRSSQESVVPSLLETEKRLEENL